MEQEKEMENESKIDSTSRANVQSLLALFGQKDQPLMGMLQPGCKLHSTSKISLSSNGENCDKNSNNNSIQNSASLDRARSSFFASQRKTSVPDVGICLDLSAINNRTSPIISPSQCVQNTTKPTLKPKPTVAQKPVKSLSSNLVKFSKTDPSDVPSNEFKESQSESLSSEEIEDNEISNSRELANQAIVNSKNLACLSKVFEKHPNMIGNNGGNQNSSPISRSLSISKFIFDEHSLSTDNYISKNNKLFKRKELPSKDKLGPAPLKPVRPLNVRLVKSPISRDSPPPLPDRILKQARLGSSASNLPPKPSRIAPPPPLSTQSISKTDSDACEDELYEDTRAPSEEKQRPVSMIPEYTEEEELGSRDSTDLEELYADGEAETPLLPPYPLPMRPNKPPPPVPETSEEEFYQDALEPDQEEVYEEMPSDLHLDEQETPLYNNRKEQDKSRKDEEKRLRKEQEKREKELIKLRKKYALTGQEIPVDTGLVKTDSRGGWYDLSVRKGETVLILRMENNPSGKWLVKNEKGKIGYVELTNIEVDADSIKSVMSLRRTSSQSVSEELYCDADAEEAIYEETY